MCWILMVNLFLKEKEGLCKNPIFSLNNSLFGHVVGLKLNIFITNNFTLMWSLLPEMSDEMHRKLCMEIS